MKKMFGDWQLQGITSVLAKRGYANNTSAIYGLADKAEALGVKILMELLLQDLSLAPIPMPLPECIPTKAQLNVNK